VTLGEAVAVGARLLEEGGVEAPRREAVYLVRALCGVDPRLDPARTLDPEQLARCLEAFARRREREPFAYVVGRREFWDLDLEVPRGVFVPRPETELVVERALAHLPAGGRAADLGTGSGAIAVALAVACPGLRVDATDVDPTALQVAAANARRHGVADRVRLLAGDLWAALPREAMGRYDLVASNPPYVDAAAWEGLEPEVRRWEPRHALVPERGWRELYRDLTEGAARWLAPGGWLVLEVGLGQAEAVAACCRTAGLEAVAIWPDLAGIPRVVEAARPCSRGG
jgi:release factor glutamine methyltransferase